MAEKMSGVDIQPVAVTVIRGTGDDGSQLTSGTAKTPASQPNLLITVISPLVAIGIRFANLFGTVLVGLVVAGMTPAGAATLQATDFLSLVWTCASLSLPAAGLGLLKDIVTITTGWERTHPLSTGSV